MAHVLELKPAEAPPTHPAHRRIQWASRALAILFTLLVVFFGAVAFVIISAFAVPWAGGHVAIGAVGMWLNIGAPVAPPPPPGYFPVGSLPLAQRGAYVAVGLVRALPELLIFWSLRQLFTLYSKGVVFAPQNTAQIKWLGVWLAVDAVAPFACHLFLTGVGLEIDHRWAHFSSVQELVLGGIVYVIAQVMEVGRQIEDERSQFV
jgi:hypothetical protein